ncbi:MAG: response regulator transcription factor [Firmicutes bacterium]|nr:response regulator transcription factor [Bacillota bacterium]
MKSLVKILVADDDREIVRLIGDSLEDEGYQVIPAYHGKQVLELLESSAVSLIILDIMMPEMDGLEVCRKIRNKIGIPIILLSAKGREIDKVVGLEVGADDYLTKPFSINELVARVKAHLRREKRKDKAVKNETGVLVFDDVAIHKDNYEVYKNGRKINLSTKEFQILLYLIENKNLVLSREQIYDAVWGVGSDYCDLNTVTVHIKNLRDKIDPQNEYIKTVWGVGYKFTGAKG